MQNRTDKFPPTSSRFGRELDLVETVKSCGYNYIFAKPSKKIAVIKEFVSTHGIADLVFLDLPSSWERRLHLAQVNPGWAYIFVLIGRKSFDVSELVKLGGCTTAYSKKVIRDLESVGFIRRLKNGKFKVANEIVPVANQITSIECKLKDWKRALSQAIRYQDFSHTSWVVLDASSKNNVNKNIAQFEKFNIGLAIADSIGNFEVLNSPRKSEPKHISSYWFANSIAAKGLSESYFINSR